MLQADGGTRTAAITGAYVALADAVTYLSAAGKLSDPRPLSCAIAAVSVGVVDGRIRVDLPYEEDSRAEVDMNVVATDTGTLVEVQGTGEGATFPRSTLDKLLDMALGACDTLFAAQTRSSGPALPGCAARGTAAAEGVRQLTRLQIIHPNGPPRARDAIPMSTCAASLLCHRLADRVQQFESVGAVVLVIGWALAGRSVCQRLPLSSTQSGLARVAHNTVMVNCSTSNLSFAKTNVSPRF